MNHYKDIKEETLGTPMDHDIEENGGETATAIRDVAVFRVRKL